MWVVQEIGPSGTWVDIEVVVVVDMTTTHWISPAMKIDFSPHKAVCNILAGKGCDCWHENV